MRFLRFQHTAARRRLPISDLIKIGLAEFQHTAARRRLHPRLINYPHQSLVSTHSRPKAAASAMRISPKLTERFQHTAARRRLRSARCSKSLIFVVSTHSRPKAAANRCKSKTLIWRVSTHSRPKAAAHSAMDVSPENLFQHTAARRRLREFGLVYAQGFQFQHTAARRRLLKIGKLSCVANNVSTHSRPKAAAKIQKLVLTTSKCFNTQPPEGGCL